MNTIEVLIGNRGGLILKINGHLYTKDRNINDKYYWKCVNWRSKGCKGRACTILNEKHELVSETSHKKLMIKEIGPIEELENSIKKKIIPIEELNLPNKKILMQLEEIKYRMKAEPSMAHQFNEEVQPSMRYNDNEQEKALNDYKINEELIENIVIMTINKLNHLYSRNTK